MSEIISPIVADDDTPDSVVLPIARAGSAVRLTRWRSLYPLITVNGKNVGSRRGAKLTFSDGSTARVKIKALIPGAPRVYVDGVEVFTTSQPPIWLVVLAAMPALSLIAMRGVLGIALALGGVLAATTIATRNGWSTAKRALTIAGVIAAAWGIALVLAIIAA